MFLYFAVTLTEFIFRVSHSAFCNRIIEAGSNTLIPFLSFKSLYLFFSAISLFKFLLAHAFYLVFQFLFLLNSAKFFIRLHVSICLNMNLQVRICTVQVFLTYFIFTWWSTRILHIQSNVSRATVDIKPFLGIIKPWKHS